MIAYLVSRTPAQYETNTKYNKRKAENFKFEGLNIVTNEINITFNFNVRKYEAVPLTNKTYQTLNQTYHVTTATKLGVKNRTFTYRPYIKKVESGFPQGALGLLIGVFDLIYRALGFIVHQQDPGKLSDAIATIAAGIATGSQAAQHIVNQNKCVNEIINQGIIYPSDVRMDDKGVWFIFKYELQNWGKLGEIMNACGVNINDFI